MLICARVLSQIKCTGRLSPVPLRHISVYGSALVYAVCVRVPNYLGRGSWQRREGDLCKQSEKMEGCRPPSYLSKLVSLLDTERPTELISSQDSYNRKKKTMKQQQTIEPFLGNKIIQEINVMCTEFIIE